jgi:hypothetical protein
MNTQRSGLGKGAVIPACRVPGVLIKNKEHHKTHNFKSKRPETHKTPFIVIIHLSAS